MPKCLECGFEASRLQWTHFKYNCTGRFASGREYKVIYPEAKLVDDELAKKTAVTKLNLIKKYGDQVGNERWTSYITKQAYSNTFESKLKSHGWTRAEFDDYNNSRACTLENLIVRHGEELGILKWEEYVERQRYTTSIEYFVSKYGNKGELKWNQFCKDRGNSQNIEFIKHKYNLSQLEAEAHLGNRYSNRFTSNAEQTFLHNIEKLIGKVPYSINSKQYCIWSNELSAPLFYDLTHSEKKKIIEYNGDYWHCNPEKYNLDFIIKQSGVTAKEVWSRDKIKLEEAKKRGFDVMVVWDSHYTANTKLVEQQILKWWNE